MARSQLERQLAELDKLKAKGRLTDDEYQLRRSAILSQPESAVAVREGGSSVGGIFKWGFFGCLGMIGAFVALIVVIAVIAAAAGGGDDEPSQPGQVGTNAGDVHVQLAVNARGEIAPERNGSRKSRVTILQIADNVESTNQFIAPAAGNKWWGVEVLVENVGTSEVTSLTWKLRDTADGEHDVALVVAAGETLNAFYNLTPGGKTQGWVYFEIPAGRGPKWLRADPNPFLENDLYLDVR